MKKEVKDILENSMKDIVLEAVKEVDIKGIMTKQIQEVTQNIARDMFGNYGEFRKELEAKLKDDLKFNIDKLKVPDFGNLAIETVIAEIKKVEYDEKDRVAKETEKRLREILGAHKDPVTLKTLQNTFALSMWKEHIKDSFDSCSCEEYDEPQDLEEIIERLNDENPFEFLLSEREWGTYGRYCTTHLYLKFEYEKYKHHIEVHIDRKRDVSNEDDFYIAEEKNIYKILGISIDGKSIKDNGFIALDSIREKTQETLVSRMINGALIDANDLAAFELVSE